MTSPPHRRRGWPRAAARFALLWLASGLAIFVPWLHATFGDISLGQIVFHWRFLGGASSISKSIGTDCAVVCGGGSLLTAAFLAWLWQRAGRPWADRRLPPSPRRALRRIGTAAPAAVVAGCLLLLASRTSAVQFLRPAGNDDFLGTHYVRPDAVAIRPNGPPKNLVLVYVESLESAYSNADVFGRDLLGSLDELGPTRFDAYRPMPGTGWTIAALVSTQCGVPLEPVGFLDAHSQGEFAKDFLPGAVCLGDILAAHGWRNVFMGGASLQFSGKGKFLSGHHYDETWGRDEWTRAGIPKSHLSGWGLHDDDLFIQARGKLRELHAAGKPFNLTLLTVDTHWPSGYLSPACRDHGAGTLDSIVECTAQQIAGLIRFVREEGYDADTQVVVVGDHLTPPNTLADRLAQVPDRTIFNAIYARSMPAPNRSEVVPFDFLPTLLDLVGLHPEHGRLGLGASALGPAPVPAADTASRAALAENVLAPSKTYIGLWEPRRAASARRGGRRVRAMP